MATMLVRCDLPNCQETAAYKIAAPWTDGIFHEMKSFGLACVDHLGPVFREAEARRKVHRPSPGEVVGDIGIYKLEPGRRDTQLQRLWGLEANYRS
jgi:hypothetical protein